MELEEKVQRSGEQLLQRMRQQTEQEVFEFVRELLTAAATERATALDDARQVADSERQTALQEESARVRAEEQKVLEAALEAARQEAARTLVLRLDEVRDEAKRTIAAAPRTDEILGRLLDGVRRLDKVSRLTDVLDTLAELAGNEAPRAAVLTVQGDRVRGWRFVGFGPTLDDEARQIDLKCGEAGIVGRAVVTGEASSVVCGPNGVPGDAEPAFTTLPSGVHALAVPVLVGGQVMAVVYGDDAERRPAPAWRESLEVLARHAGHCLEALTAVRTAQLAHRDVESLIPEDGGPTGPFDAAGAERPKPRA